MMWPPEHERFADRTQAGQALATEVAAHLTHLLTPEAAAPGAPKARAPLVLALPRGGVPVGFEVAKALDADFDLIIARKIGLPWQPHFGVGAIAEAGPPVFDRGALAGAGLNGSDLHPAVERERIELRRRQERYRGQRPAPDVAGRVVIVVDDGLASGVTARAAVRALRAGGPAHLVFAAPVCAAESEDWLSAETDAVVDIHSPREFFALGLFYRDFGQVTDEDVEATLLRAWGAAAVG